VTRAVRRFVSGRPLAKVEPAGETGYRRAPMILRLVCTALVAAALAGCAGRRAATRGVPPPPAVAPVDARVPDFATKPYAPFSREDAVAIALREWRLFGSPVDDDPPGARPLADPEQKPERQPGLWQRVGEYWYVGQDPRLPEGDWTGKHDEFGRVFPADQDGQYPWSAAFISYVMRIAAAGDRFPYSPSHSDYINVGRQMSLGWTSGYVVWAERPDAYAPGPGDLICFGRLTAARLRFSDLPTGRFPSHCSIVTATGPNDLDVVGGNVDDAVTLTHVPVTADGRLAGPDGVVLDYRYPWFVVLRVLYDR